MRERNRGRFSKCGAEFRTYSITVGIGDVMDAAKGSKLGTGEDMCDR